MAQIINLVAERIERAMAPVKPVILASDLTRTPELAFILAMVEAMPADMRGQVLLQVSDLPKRFPDCDASERAANIAALLSLTLGGR